jgi:hypothetical protein
MAGRRTFRAFLWPTRMLITVLVVVAALIAVTVRDPLGALTMLVVLGGLAVWIVHRPGVELTADGMTYRPFFRRRRRFSWQRVRGVSVETRQGRPGSTFQVIGVRTDGRDLMLWVLAFHSAAWTQRVRDVLDAEARQGRRRSA